MLNMFKKKSVFIPFIFIVLFIIAFFISKQQDKDQFFVETAKVTRQTIIQKVNASGKIQPEEEVQITSTITGWITKITVSEGDTVQPRQHLISIDEKQYRPLYNQALSRVKSAEANMNRVQSELERTKTLFAQNLVSKQDLERLEASFQIALSEAEQARANLLSAEDELSKTKLTAPKYGIVTSITKEEGEMAVGGMFNPGVLMSIADLSKMEVEVDVNENDVINIEIGDTSEIEIDAYPDTLFFGVVSEIAHTAESLNMGSQQQVTNFKVKIRIIDVPEKIRPGMSSTVNIVTKTLENVLSIPIQALTSRFEDYAEQSIKNLKKKKKWERDNEKNQDQDFQKAKTSLDIVFILKDSFDGNLAPKGKKYALVKPVKVGISGENNYAVLSGLKDGDRIVTGGYRVLSKELYHGSLVVLRDFNENEVSNPN
tara:strand:+ start:1005 stop:2291 length:1287 start_codon:yes stop_codon:yes gene_type:complete